MGRRANDGANPFRPLFSRVCLPSHCRSRVVDRIEKDFHKFEPQELVPRYSWLFSHRPELPEGREMDREERGRFILVWFNARRNPIDCCSLASVSVMFI